MALTPEEIDGLRELILAVYGPVTEELLRDLCRCITAAGQISSGDEYKLLLAKSLAGADDVIADTLRRQTDLTDDAVEQLMRWAAEKTAPLEENESLRNIAEAYVKVTRKEVANVLGQLAAADVDGQVYPIKDVYRRTMDYVFREVALDEVLRQALRRFSAEFIDRRLRLDYTPTGLTVLTDEKWLCFVLEQLLSNALKYTREGSITVELAGERVLAIRDTGIGIAPEDLPRIFEKGYTGQNGRADKRASGLGLYLCSRICRNLGVGLTVKSTSGVGTTLLLDFTQYPLRVE